MYDLNPKSRRPVAKPRGLQTSYLHAAKGSTGSFKPAQHHHRDSRPHPPLDPSSAGAGSSSSAPPPSTASTGLRASSSAGLWGLPGGSSSSSGGQSRGGGRVFLQNQMGGSGDWERRRRRLGRLRRSGGCRAVGDEPLLRQPARLRAGVVVWGRLLRKLAGDWLSRSGAGLAEACCSSAGWSASMVHRGLIFLWKHQRRGILDLGLML